MNFKKYSFLTLILSCFLAASPVIFAQDSLTALDVAKIKTVGSVYMSPDGKSGAYTLSVPVDPFEENAPPKTHLYSIDINTGESEALIESLSVSGVSYRPQYNSITYLAKKEGDKTTSLYEVSTDGNSQKIFEFETNIAGYTWAQDGNHLVFMANEPEEKEESPLPYSPEIYEENFSNRLAYVQNLNRDGHETHSINVEGVVYDAVFSPDQSKLALAVAPTPHVDDFYMKQQ